jgi:hypothetical protein
MDAKVNKKVTIGGAKKSGLPKNDQRHNIACFSHIYHFGRRKHLQMQNFCEIERVFYIALLSLSSTSIIVHGG